jgi:O-antigen/teichoic acid export membrane protein
MQLEPQTTERSTAAAGHSARPDPAPEPGGRTRRSAWGFAASLAFSAVTLAVGFVSTPILLRWLGVPTFGAFRALQDWFGYLTLFELGLSGALMAQLAPASGRGIRAEICGNLAAGLRAYLNLIPAVLLIGGVWAFSVPHLMGAGAPGSAGDLRVAAGLLLIPLLWLPLAAFRVLAESQQRLYVVQGLLIGQSLLTTLLLLAAARAGFGLWGQSLATAAAQLPAALALAWSGWRRYPEVRRTAPCGDATRRLWSLNAPTFAFNLASRISLLSDNVVIAALLGPAAVAPFFLTQRLVSIAQAQLQGIGNATWAGLVELHARGDHEAFRSRLLELTSLVSSLGCATLIPICALNRFFTWAWVGPENYGGTAVNVVVTINAWLWSVTSLWGWPISATGRVGRYLPYVLCFTAINFGVSVAGTLTIGLAGPLIGTLAGFALVQSWALPKLLHEAFGISPRLLWKAALSPARWAVPFGAAVFALGRYQGSRNVLVIAIEMGALALVGLALWWMFSLSPGSRRKWSGRIRLALAY